MIPDLGVTSFYRTRSTRFIDILSWSNLPHVGVIYLSGSTFVVIVFPFSFGSVLSDSGFFLLFPTWFVVTYPFFPH